MELHIDVIGADEEVILNIDLFRPLSGKFGHYKTAYSITGFFFHLALRCINLNLNL
jgi:hypothetical protein